MILKAIFSLCLTASAITYAVAKPCSNLDLRKLNPSLREHYSIPYDQGRLNWCYAFAAADLMAAEIGEPVSPLHAASLHNKYIQQRPLLRTGHKIFNPSAADLEGIMEFGWIEKTIAAMVKKRQVCPEATMPFDFLRSGETLKMLKSLGQIKAAIQNQSLSLSVVEQWLTRELPAYLRQGLDLRLIASSLLQDDINLTVELMASNRCRTSMLSVPRVKVKRMNVSLLKTKPEVVAYFKALDETLEQGKAVAVGYNLKHFTEGDGQHASIITARRNTAQGCEYKVRNSFGDSCVYYKNNVKCIKKEGAFWVKAPDMINYRMRLFYLAR
jgi:hypothetical protein